MIRQSTNVIQFSNYQSRTALESDVAEQSNDETNDDIYLDEFAEEQTQNELRAHIGAIMRESVLSPVEVLAALYQELHDFAQERCGMSVEMSLLSATQKINPHPTSPPTPKRAG